MLPFNSIKRNKHLTTDIKESDLALINNLKDVGKVVLVVAYLSEESLERASK